MKHTFHVLMNKQTIILFDEFIICWRSTNRGMFTMTSILATILIYYSFSARTDHTSTLWNAATIYAWMANDRNQIPEEEQFRCAKHTRLKSHIDFINYLLRSLINNCLLNCWAIYHLLRVTSTINLVVERESITCTAYWLDSRYLLNWIIITCQCYNCWLALICI